MQAQVVTVLGGSGFLGRYIVQHLAKQGALIKVGCRHITEAMHLMPMGNVGQIKLVPTNIRDEASLKELIQDSDIVINLVGILYEKGKQTFEAVHVDGARRLAQLAKEFEVKQFIHMSALAADKESKSSYARSKFKGEAAVRQAFPEATILRPSLVFGAEDNFFNRFAELALKSPALPLIGGGETKFQPVYVGDVAAAVQAIIEQQLQGPTFELGGPTIYTFKELMTLLLQQIQRQRVLIPVPYAFGFALGALAQLLPEPLLTIDQVRLLQGDSITTGELPGLSSLQIQPQALPTILPTYLARFRGGK